MKTHNLPILLVLLCLLCVTGCTSASGNGLTEDEKATVAKSLNVSIGTVEAFHELSPVKCDSMKDKTLRDACVSQVLSSREYGSFVLADLTEEKILKQSYQTSTKDEANDQIHEFYTHKLYTNEEGSLFNAQKQIREEYNLSMMYLKVNDLPEKQCDITEIFRSGRSYSMDIFDNALDIIESELGNIKSAIKQVSSNEDSTLEPLEKIAKKCAEKLRDYKDAEGHYFLTLGGFYFVAIEYYIGQKALAMQCDLSRQSKKRLRRIEKILQKLSEPAIALVIKLNIEDFKKSSQKIIDQTLPRFHCVYHYLHIMPESLDAYTDFTDMISEASWELNREDYETDAEFNLAESFHENCLEPAASFPKDPAGHSFKYQATEDVVTLISAGLDGIFGNSDDISLTITPKQLEPYEQALSENLAKAREKAPKNTHQANAPREAPTRMAPPPQTQRAPNLTFVRDITYPNKTKPSWLIFKDQLGRFCAVITSSQYPILQENGYCIPFSGNDKALKDSFAGHAVAEINYPEHRQCKKLQPVSSNAYCNRFYKSFMEAAEIEHYVKFKKICQSGALPHVQKYCQYLE